MKELRVLGVMVRPFRPDDAESLAESASQPDIGPNLRNSFPTPCTARDAKKLIDEAISMEKAHSFALADGLDRVIGGIALSPGEDIHSGSAELGYWIVEEYRNRGIMTEAVRKITDYCLSELSYIRIFALVRSRNWASRAVLEKNGYTLEGTLRRHMKKNGKVYDLAVYSFTDMDKERKTGK